MQEFDCTFIYAHTFAEIECEMGKTKRGARLTIRVTEAGRHHDLQAGDERAFAKKNIQFSPFYKDVGTWVDESGYEKDGLCIVRDFMASLTRCGFKYRVTLG